MALTPTTELEAVNRILASIGAGKVNTLTGAIPADAAKAQARLNEVSRELQKMGYQFNTDVELTLTKAVDKTVTVPPNTLDVTFEEFETDLTLRGRKVYDFVKHTYKIDRNIVADVVVFLPFDELPEHARAYIFYAAGQSIQDEELGDTSAHQIKDDDVKKAWRDFLQWDAEHAKYSFKNNRMMKRIIKRRPVTG